MFAQIGDPIVYWSLRLLLLAILINSGWNISYKDKDGSNFWTNALPSIIAYSLIQGLRWNRGADYPHYYQDLTGKLVTDYKESVYLLWIDFFKWTGMPGPVGFVFYSFLLIFAFCCVLKYFRKGAIWALPLFLLMTNAAENIIRQYFAVSFVLFAYYYYLRGINYRKQMWLCLIIVPMIHLSGLFADVIFLICIYAHKIRLDFKWKLWCLYPLLGLYLYVYFFWDTHNFSYVVDFLSSLEVGDDTYRGLYVTNSERWFTEEGSITYLLTGKAAVRTISLLNEITFFLTNVIMICCGYFILNRDSRFLPVFWFTYLAIILKGIGGDIEMYARFYNWLIYLAPIACGLILVEKWSTKFKIEMIINVIFFIYFGFYGVLRQLGSMGYAGCAFIWDK